MDKNPKQSVIPITTLSTTKHTSTEDTNKPKKSVAVKKLEKF
jgi:hypothetical protein